MVEHTIKRAPSDKDSPSNALSKSGIWLHNDDGNMNDLVHDMSNYGVHEWNGDNEWFVDWFHVQSTPEALLASVGSLNYWLGSQVTGSVRGQP